MIPLRGIPRSVAEWVLLIKIKLLILQILMLMLVASLLAIPRREVATNHGYNPINYERILIISISTILVILILLLRYLIVSIEDLKAQIVAYKEQVIKGQTYTDDLLNDISKDVEYIRANVNNKDMYDTCIGFIKTIYNTLLDYINKDGKLSESIVSRLMGMTNEITTIIDNHVEIQDKFNIINDIVNRINDNTTPKTKIKAKNSSKKLE